MRTLRQGRPAYLRAGEEDVVAGEDQGVGVDQGVRVDQVAGEEEEEEEEVVEGR